MRTRRLPAALTTLTAALLTSCASTSSLPIEQKAPPIALLHSGNSSQLAAGRALYLGKCTKCHTPEVIAEHSLIDWKDDILPLMTKKAKTTPDETAALLAYITAAHAIPLAPIAPPIASR